MPRLIMRRGPRPGNVYELTAEIVTIGSGSKNDLVILDNDVSREHCRLVRVMADYELQDLDSRRGTFVSGQRVESGWVLKPGSIIELGENVTLEYERRGVTSELNRVIVERSDSGSVQAVYPFLVMTVGLNHGQVYPLESENITIGRDLSNDIVLPDPEVSRFHLKLRRDQGSYVIEDLGSTNGTAVSGEPLVPGTSRTLRANDTIQLASIVEFRYTWDQSLADAQAGARSGDAAPKADIRKTLAGADTNEVKSLGLKTTKRHTTRLGTGLQPGALVDHVFIAYAREEWEAIVAPIMAVLQDAGIKVWVDQYLVQGGDDWMLAVEQALSECWLLLVIVSPPALDSRYVRLAYRYFFNRDKPILPLLYAPVEALPPELKAQKTARLERHDGHSGFDEVVREVRQRRAQP